MQHRLPSVRDCDAVAAVLSGGRVECGVALHSDFHSGQRAALIIRNSACDRTLLSVQGRGRQQEDRHQKYCPFHCQNSKGYT